MIFRRVLLGAGVVASALILAGAIETSVAFTRAGVTTARAAQPSGSAPAFVPDAASRVNLFVGTTNGGHVFPGKFLSTDQFTNVVANAHGVWYDRSDDPARDGEGGDGHRLARERESSTSTLICRGC